LRCGCRVERRKGRAGLFDRGHDRVPRGDV
jgi:hypothetical protein